MKKRLLPIAAIVVACLAILGLRVVLEGRAALAEGDAALADKRVGDAIAAWESAARWYLPGAPHVDEAYARLLELARGPGRPHERLAAWRAVRSAALATRSFWTPHGGDLAEANAAIAEAAAADPEAALAVEAPVRRAWHEGALAADPRPSVPATALAILGIVLWLGGIGAVVRRGAARDRPTLVAATIAVAGLLAWAVGLYSA